jgi:hypothetical protein
LQEHCAAVLLLLMLLHAVPVWLQRAVVLLVLVLAAVHEGRRSAQQLPLQLRVALTVLPLLLPLLLLLLLPLDALCELQPEPVRLLAPQQRLVLQLCQQQLSE